MVGPVSRDRREWLGFVFLFLLGSRTAGATEVAVTVRCEELSNEDAAQIEARVRANLLSAGLTPTDLVLSCNATSVQTEVRGQGRRATVRTERNASPLKEALLTSADAALDGWVNEPNAPGPTAPAPTPPPAASPTPAPEPRATAEKSPSQRAAINRLAVAPSPSTTWFFAGMRAEPWRDGFGLGAQLGAEHVFGAGFASIQGGYLFGFPSSTLFSAREVQFGAQLGWQPQRLLGVRGAFGFGLSVLGASPAAGVSSPSDITSSAAPFLSVELSRPLQLTDIGLLPVIGLRAFPNARSVQVNGQPALTLPAVTMEASLNFALRVGG